MQLLQKQLLQLQLLQLQLLQLQLLQLHLLQFLILQVFAIQKIICSFRVVQVPRHEGPLPSEPQRRGRQTERGRSRRTNRETSARSFLETCCVKSTTSQHEDECAG